MVFSARPMSLSIHSQQKLQENNSMDNVTQEDIKQLEARLDVVEARQESIEARLDAIEYRIYALEEFYGLFSSSHHTMVIYWSGGDQCYLVSVPDLKKHVMNWNTLTHGDTYEEAARNGTEAIEVALADDAATQALGG
jgi:predicted RNase H-like HicB family nuclease